MIVIDNDSKLPLYLQIYEQIKQDIISGKITEGSKLLSTRALSTTLNVSRNTVESAYLQLYSEGYVRSKAGSGYIVEKLDKGIMWKIKSHDIDNIQKPSGRESGEENFKFDFKYGVLNPEDFPLRLWKKISNKCLTTLSLEDITSYGDPKGELGLRVEIMKYLNKSRGVYCKPEQIILSSGSEHCLSLICQLFRKEHKGIAIEEPGYSGARDIFLNNGYEVYPITLEDDGINIGELERSSSKIVYVTPSHQFPTGLVMPIQKRLKLLDWAVRNKGIIIEDDYDSEMRYNSKPIPSIQCIDSKEYVIYIGTFSKSLSPSLRLSYMVLPPGLLAVYNKLFSKYQASVPLTEQKIIQEFMRGGHWERHLRKVCISNKKKHDLLIQKINELMGDRVVIHGKNAGMHILLELTNGLCEEEIIKRAKDHGVRVYSVSTYWMKLEGYSNNMVLLGFGGMSENNIIEAINILNEAWFHK